MNFLTGNFKKIKFSKIFWEIFWWLGAGLFLVSIGIALNPYAFKFFDLFRTDFLDTMTVFLTEELIWWFHLIFTLWAIWALWKNPKNYAMILTPLLSFMIVGICVEILKSFFAVARPYEIFPNLKPLVYPDNKSFPSGHTAIVFSVLFPLYKISKKFGIIWFFIALTIGISRIYENVHYPSDIGGGIFLGGFIGSLFTNTEFKKLVKTAWHHFEFRRQSFHFLFGLSMVFFHWSGYLQLRWIAVVLVLGLIISILSQFRVLPIISDFLATFDRKRDKNFPGRGAFYFLLGVFLTFSFFKYENLNIAYASILIMSVGDSLNHLFCSSLKKGKVWWNPRKNWLGVFIGIIAGIFAAQFFVPLHHAIIAASIAIVMETITLKIKNFYLDDNLVVPILAGTILFILKKYPCWFQSYIIYQYLT